MRNLVRLVMATAIGGMAAFAGVVAQPIIASAAGTWTAQNPGINSVYPGIFPVDKNNAWLVGGEHPTDLAGLGGKRTVVLHTTNAGTTWVEDAGALAAEKLAAGHELKKAFFVGNDGWIIGEQADINDTCPSTLNSPAWHVILHTTDGGQTWKRLTAPVTTLDQCDDLEAVYATSATDAWITVGSSGTKTDGSQHGIIHWDGSTLKFVSFGAGSCFARDGVSFPPKAGSTSRAEGWVVDEQFNQQTSRTEACIMHTTNGGVSWSQQTVSGCASLVVTSPFPETQSNCGSIEDIFCTDTQHCWGSGDTFNDSTGASVAKWNGTSWKAHAVDSAGTAGCHQSDFDGVAFTSPLIGYTVGELRCPGGDSSNDTPQMWSTGDGGVTWAKVALPAGHGPLVAIRFADPCNGWAVGERGTVFHFSDPTGCLVASQAPASVVPVLPKAGADSSSPVPVAWVVIVALAGLGLPLALRSRRRAPR